MGLTIAMTGGGTAGHVFPALSVYEYLIQHYPDLEFFWIGSARGMEAKILSGTAIPFYSVPCGKLRRYLSLRNFFDLFRIVAGFFAALWLLLRRRPDVLFSKGGYVSVPPVWAAALLRIPVVSHESDMTPGLATRLNSRFSRIICVSNQPAADAIGAALQKRVHITGIPVRRAAYFADGGKALKALGLGEDDLKRPVIMVIGGSQGAAVLNSLVADNLDLLLSRGILIHQTGDLDIEALDRRPGYFPARFFSDNHLDLMAASTLVITRAGATTLWECAVLGKPMLLVPLGRAQSRGDQILNADYFYSMGAAIVLPEEEAGAFAGRFESLMRHPEKLARMGQAARTLAGEDASRTIGELLLQLSGRENKP